MIDTHSHIDSEEFRDDIDETIQRAKDTGIEKILIPAIDHASCQRILDICSRYRGTCYPMLGLHPEEVKSDWQSHLEKIRSVISKERKHVVAIGEIGLDYYWSREFEAEQVMAFEQQICWAIEERLPLMIHCRKAQNEMVRIIRKYEKNLIGGVFHCFTGNVHEAAELLQFQKFSLGIGGVLTFKKSVLPETLAKVVPLERIVLETDAPYMAPVPHRGKRNEPAYVKDICLRLADIYNTTPEDIDLVTTRTAENIFGV